MRIPVIAGPTASGKSGMAFNAALVSGNAEIISADAFQVYKFLDIGTAKPLPEERALVQHHLIDILNPNECYSAGMFAYEAEKIIEDILSRGKIPIVAGGTGLYIQSLTDGIFDCPAIDKKYRECLLERKLAEGLGALYNELQEIDREYAAKISFNDPVRIIRALEVYYSLGITFTEAHKKYRKKPRYEYTIVIPETDRKILYDTINARTVNMWRSGWKDEVERLLNMGYSKEVPSFRAIGYGIIADCLDGKIDDERAVERISKETRNFAKRQLTWFRKREGVKFYNDKKTLEEHLKEYICGYRSEL